VDLRPSITSQVFSKEVAKSQNWQNTVNGLTMAQMTQIMVEKKKKTFEI
jgi:hypothetical protein